MSWDLQGQSLLASVSAKPSTVQLEEPKIIKWYKKEKRKVKIENFSPRVENVALVYTTSGFYLGQAINTTRQTAESPQARNKVGRKSQKEGV